MISWRTQIIFACGIPFSTLATVLSCPLLIPRSEKAIAPHSSTLAWKIPWIEKPGRLQSMGLLRVRHD